MDDLLKEAITPEEIEEELRLWRRWKAGDQQSLEPLMNRFEPIMNKWYGKVSYSQLPPSAIKGELELQMIRAFERFDPHRGVKLSTWVEANMPKIMRFTNEHQNIGRIPEHRARMISTFESAKGTLSDGLGRPPSAQEISDELGWRIEEVSTLERELRKDLSQSSDFEDMVIGTSTTEEAMRWVYQELTGQEKLVFEWLTGWGGKPIIKQIAIAANLGVSSATITNIRKRIVQRIKTAEGII